MAKVKKTDSEVKTKSRGQGGQWRWLWLTFFIIVLDLASKNMINYYLSRLSEVTVTPFLNLVLVYNTGSAFGFLANQNGWQLWLFVAVATLVSIGILTWLWKSSTKHAFTAIALCLILGGTLGNVYDRIVEGYVVDFIDFHVQNYHWPAFNIADSAICIGAFFLLLSAFRKA